MLRFYNLSPSNGYIMVVYFHSKIIKIAKRNFSSLNHHDIHCTVQFVEQQYKALLYIIWPLKLSPHFNIKPSWIQCLDEWENAFRMSVLYFLIVQPPFFLLLLVGCLIVIKQYLSAIKFTEWWNSIELHSSTAH